jgi:hypothetical protein
VEEVFWTVLYREPLLAALRNGGPVRFMSIHFLDAVIIGSVPLMLDLIDLGRDHEDFFEARAVASEKERQARGTLAP